MPCEIPEGNPSKKRMKGKIFKEFHGKGCNLKGYFREILAKNILGNTVRYFSGKHARISLVNFLEI